MRSGPSRSPLGTSGWLRALTLATSVLLVGVHALYSRGNHNEEMYVAAGALLKTQTLYSDYVFLQAPLLPLLHAAAFALSGGEHLLLSARLHTWLWGALTLAATQALVQRASAGYRWLAPATTLALVTQRVFVTNVSESSNYISALGTTLLATLALSFAVDGSTWPQARRAYCVLSGVAAGAAAACKLNDLLSLAALGAVVWLYRRRLQRWHWLAGALLGLTPLFYYAARDFDGLWFGNVSYHLSNVELLRSTRSSRVELAGKAHEVWRIGRQPLTLALAAFGMAGVSGPFAYRVGDLQPQTRERRLPLIGPQGVAALFAERSPDALLLGLDERYEGAFKAYASQAGDVQQPKNTLRRGRLWLPEDGDAAELQAPDASP